MNKYVIAFLSLHNGEMLQELVESESDLHAGIAYLEERDWEWDEIPNSLEELYEIVFNCDAYISVVDLEALKTNGGGDVLQKRIA